MEYLEKIFRAMGNRKRLEILRLLSQKRELSLNVLSDRIKLSPKATFGHVNRLFQLGILEKERQGNNMFYKISRSPPKLVRTLFAFIKK
jgi:DNA-binding transcriptional ArsR family regulator